MLTIMFRAVSPSGLQRRILQTAGRYASRKLTNIANDIGDGFHLDLADNFHR